MKWVVIVKFTDGVKAVMNFDTFSDAITEMYKWNYDTPFYGRNPVKVTIEKMAIIENEE